MLDPTEPPRSPLSVWVTLRWPDVHSSIQQKATVCGVITAFVLSLIGLGACVGFLVQGFTPSGAVIPFSTPLVPAWGALLLCIFSFFVFDFWVFTGIGSSRGTRIVVACVGGAVAVCGLILVVSFGVTKGFDQSIVWGVLWLISGTICVLLSMLWVRSRAAAVASGEGVTEVQIPVKSCPCVRKLGRCIGVTILLIFVAFGAGFTIQAAWGAADFNAFPPPGTIYTVSVKDITVDMHLYCVGPTGKGPTIIGEHGGGASSVSFRYIQQQLAGRGHRFCAYDRIGYGWTPSTVQGMNITDVTSGDVLTVLLKKAEETGPFICIGHSAGAAACLLFAHAQGAGNMKGIVFLDGYPDYVSAWSYGTKISVDPAKISAMSHGMLFGVGAISFVGGPTAFTHGIVGNPGPDFVPQDARGPFTAMYGQSRFWMSQYWDLYGSSVAGVDGYVFKAVGGNVNAGGYVRFDRVLLPGTPFLMIPAYSTVHPTNPCTGPDCTSYYNQASYYATDISNNGTLVIAPNGSAHDFVYNGKYAPWIVSTIIPHFSL